MVTALQAGDEGAFAHVLDHHSAALLRVAMLHVSSRQVAEEVVQDAWLAVIQGIDRFERRSSFKTWLFQILLNKARTRGARERRSVPFSSAGGAGDSWEGAVPPERFRGVDDPEFPHWWASYPTRWDTLPERRLIGRETLDEVRAAIDALTPRQREVVTLRDVHGWTADEVSAHLGLTAANQRVLLHRARSKVRLALEEYLDDGR